MIKVKPTSSGATVWDTKNHITIRLNKKETEDKLKIKTFPKDSSPDVVHLEISDTCNLNCSYCYVKGKTGKELRTNQWKFIIRQLASAGIFQVTFGGGEPTLRKDLIQLAQYVKDVGLNLCMTTNGLLIPKFKPEELQLFDQINVSFHNSNAWTKERFIKALDWLQKCGVKRGINFTLSKQYESKVDYIGVEAKIYDAELLFLTYKSVNGDLENVIEPEKVMKTAKQIGKDYGVKVAVDGMTCGKCEAHSKFCDVDSLGNVLPCSFIRKPLGNLIKKSFKEIWSKRGEKPDCPYLKK